MFARPLYRLVLAAIVTMLVNFAGNGTAWAQEEGGEDVGVKLPVACDLTVSITEVIEVVDRGQASNTVEAYYQAQGSTPVVRFTSRIIEYFVPVTVTVRDGAGGRPIRLEDSPDESIKMDPAIHTLRPGSSTTLVLGVSRGTIDILRGDLKRLIRDDVVRRFEDEFGNQWTVEADWRDAYARISVEATDGDGCTGIDVKRQWLLDPNMRSRIIAR